MAKIFNLLLLCLTAFGGVHLFRLQRAVGPLRAEYARVSARHESIEVKNPQNYYVSWVETGDPMAFEWYCYQPPAVSYVSRIHQGAIEYTRGTLQGSPNGDGSFHRIAFGFRDGSVRYYWKRNRTGSSVMTVSPEFADFLQSHWGELRITALARGESAVEFPPDAVLDFLTIEVPPQLKDELEAAVGERMAEEVMSDPIFRLSLSSEDALIAAEYHGRR